MRFLVIVLPVILTACSSSSVSDRPVGISKSIHGLKQSPCNCGGLETKKEAKNRAGRIIPAATMPHSSSASEPAQYTNSPAQPQSNDKD